VLYDFLDESALFQAQVDRGSRSLMNVCFRTGSDELDAKFVSEATRAGLEGLKGHRSAGGMRASIYNACPPEAVRALVGFMQQFEGANRPAAAAAR
jgi:phosphoserine aminotransferase